MSYLFFFLYLFFSVIIFHFINRILFIIWFQDRITTLPFWESIYSLFAGWKMDISFFSYLMLAIFPIFSILIFNKNPKLFTVLKSYIGIFIALIFFLSAVIAGSETALYSEWGTKLNWKSIDHLKNRAEVFMTATMGHYFTVFLFLIVGLAFIYFYFKKIHPHIPIPSYTQSIKNITKRVLLLIVTLPILIIMVRGGLRPIPLSESDAYFSNHLILNDIAVNPQWNLGHSLLTKNAIKNEYQKYDSLEVNTWIKKIHSPIKDTTLLFLENKKPNLIFIILESWTADVVGALGASYGVTNHFDSLAKEGFLFTQFYSNGWTSDQAMTSLFSSFPVMPYVTVINELDKCRNLPSLSNTLKKEGYHSSFYYGGQLSYGNTKGYLLSNGFDIVQDQIELPKMPSARLGIHDEYLFTLFFDRLKEKTSPFLSAVFTLSSHSPYDIPADTFSISYQGKHSAFLQSVQYTDRQLGKFFQKAKHQSWYQNALFILVADHSHASPKERKRFVPKRYRIPLLFLGNPLKNEYKNKKFSKISSQIDLTKTLLNQMGLSAHEYSWGKNLMNPYEQNFSFFAFDRGYGWQRDSCYFAYSERYQKILGCKENATFSKDSLRKESELYLQKIFKDYQKL